jgi:hypothetical protein
MHLWRRTHGWKIHPLNTKISLENASTKEEFTNGKLTH